MRHGASKALIRIELHHDRGANIVITREITNDNRSTWKIQDEAATQKQVFTPLSHKFILDIVL